MWHCPHCGAPQAETARCWVCRKSSTTCSTCRHFRASLASTISYCALDRARRPLTGLELRGCWSERQGATDAPAGPGELDVPAAARAWPSVPHRAFVPLEDVAPTRPADLEAPQPPAIAAVAEALEIGEIRTSLFGELDR
jgi:hypothetical protein